MPTPDRAANPQLPATASLMQGPSLWRRWRSPLVGLVVFAAVMGAGSYMVALESGRLEAQQQADLRAYGSSMRIRVSQELSNVLYLSSGLSSYMAVRQRNQDRQEITQILSLLYVQTRHVRNFGIAVGTTLTYVYPVEGNQQAIGLRYPDIPAQWPGVKAVIDSGKPLLAGPLNLVQGGRGLIYRVPIIIRDQYWGLLSTVVDADSLFSAAFSNLDEKFEFALRAKTADGHGGRPIWGDDAVFARPGIALVDIDIPGGQWVFGLRAKAEPAGGGLLRQMRALTWLLALLCGWIAFQLLRQRERFANLALHDALTGLPNRRLIDDRILRVILQQRRDPAHIAAVLLVDLNGFKPVNDRHGHKAGDMVLRVIADRVAKTLRTVDTIGRWGGDEFVIVLERLERDKLPEIVSRIRETVSQPISHDKEELRVGAAIGVAIIPDDGDSAAELIRLADRRMYDNKPGQAGR